MTSYTPSSWTRAVSANIIEALMARDTTNAEFEAATGLGQRALGRRLSGYGPWTLDEVYLVAQFLQVDVWRLLAPDLATT